MKINYSEINEPIKDCSQKIVQISDQTIKERLNKVLTKINERHLDGIIIYGDVEHGNNFEYLVGFLPRFEEALLVLFKDGSASLVFGNENFNKVSKSRIKANGLLASYFSLSNQPMQNNEPLIEILRKTGISNKRMGIVGWKNFTSNYEDNKQMYDMPTYIFEPIKKLCGENNISNETDIFIGKDGVRLKNNANEIAHYEFFASLASDSMLDGLNSLKEGVSEMEVADKLNRYGQRNSIITICAFGPRFINGNMYPTDNKLKKSDTISMTISYRGGLSSRSLFAAKDENDLPQGQKDYLEIVVKPYYQAMTTWLENVHIGMKGKEIYQMIEDVLPQNKYHWLLNPGHTTADEEWLNSPIYANSDEQIVSGMIFQTDIIPSVEGYHSTNMESTCVFADEKLKSEIKKDYPDLWNRMMQRREYIINKTGIMLNDDILPMCSTLTYLRPFAFSKKAMCKETSNQ